MERPVVHGAVVEDAMGDVGSGCPLGCTGDGRNGISRRILQADGDVEGIEQMEGLANGGNGLGQDGC